MFLKIEGKIKKEKKELLDLFSPAALEVSLPRGLKKNDWGVYFSWLKLGGRNYPGITAVGPWKAFRLNRTVCRTYLLTGGHDFTGRRVAIRLIFKFRQVGLDDDWRAFRRQIKADLKKAKIFFGL